MNFAAFERAQVAAFAYREARFTGSLDAMRAVCFVLRNRVKSAWGDGTFLSVMEGAHLTAASNDLGGPQLSVGSGLNGAALASDRLLQLMVRDVDDIYMGSESFEDSVAQITAAHKQANEPWKPMLYYSFLNRPARPWFVENIIQRPLEHAQVAQIGSMMLYR
jgi:hypothetical protein